MGSVLLHTQMTILVTPVPPKNLTMLRQICLLSLPTLLAYWVAWSMQENNNKTIHVERNFQNKQDIIVFTEGQRVDCYLYLKTIELDFF